MSKPPPSSKKSPKSTENHDQPARTPFGTFSARASPPSNRADESLRTRPTPPRHEDDDERKPPASNGIIAIGTPAGPPPSVEAVESTSQQDKNSKHRPSLAAGVRRQPSTSIGQRSRLAALQDSIARKQNDETSLVSGPSLAPMMSDEISTSIPAAVAAVRASTSPSKGPRLAPIVPTQELEPEVSQPGAFAIEGFESRSSEHEATEVVSRVVPAPPEIAPIIAELHDDTIYDGAVVLDDDMPDEKHRMRWVQVLVACCSLVALILVIVTFTLDDGARRAPEFSLKGWSIQSELFPDDPQPQTWFGTALAADETRLVVVAPGATGNRTGHVFVYEQDTEGQYVPVSTLDGPSGTTERASVALASNRLAVGWSTGLVEIWEERSTGWFTYPPILGTDNDWFGHSLAMSKDGQTMVVGAPLANDGHGAVRVYQIANNQWVQVGPELVGAEDHEAFGWSVDIQETLLRTRIVAGGPMYRNETGIVRMFEWDEGWTETASLTGSREFSRFGDAVAMAPKALAVGARGSLFERGEVFVYRERDGGWQPDDFEFSSGTEGDGFGASVSMSEDGSTLVIGTPQDSLVRPSGGTVSVFSFDALTESWSTEGGVLAIAMAESDFGSSAAVSPDGSRVICGAPSATFDGSVAQAGSVTVFDRVA